MPAAPVACCTDGKLLAEVSLRSRNPKDRLKDREHISIEQHESDFNSGRSNH